VLQDTVRIETDDVKYALLTFSDWDNENESHGVESIDSVSELLL